MCAIYVYIISSIKIKSTASGPILIPGGQVRKGACRYHLERWRPMSAPRHLLMLLLFSTPLLTRATARVGEACFSITNI